MDKFCQSCPLSWGVLVISYLYLIVSLVAFLTAPSHFLSNWKIVIRTHKELLAVTIFFLAACGILAGSCGIWSVRVSRRATLVVPLLGLLVFGAVSTLVTMIILVLASLEVPYPELCFGAAALGLQVYCYLTVASYFKELTRDPFGPAATCAEEDQLEMQALTEPAET